MTAYPRFAVTVDLVALMIRDEQLSTLLIRRGGEPFKGRWALPGGFVQRGPRKKPESLDEAAAREFEEETGLPLRVAHLEQLAAYGDPERDPRGNVVTIAYLAVAPMLSQPRAGGDAAEARWVPVNMVLDESLSVAFDHARIIADAVERTRELIETTALATTFCDEWFTVPSLRRVYEIVWDLPRDSLDPGNFHNRVTIMPGLIEAVSQRELNAGSSDTSNRVTLSAAPPLAGPARTSATQSSRGRPPRLFKAGPLIREAGPAARLDRPIERPWERRVDGAAFSAATRTPDTTEPGERPRPSVERPTSIEPEAWEAAKRRARSIIWERGRAGADIHYGELASSLELHVRSGTFFDLLDSLCVDEAAEGGPMVTALVVNKRTGMPGQRFFVLAESLGRDFTSLSEFAESERQRVFDWVRAHPERVL